ncbi:hypothetical protein RW1_041_00160 [Rhodococcus wratislaviensis NBRC 100605]|uniref:Uncharacterized protein n=1 Tax=Rhodococcus wratislaviensis NBRC 100605 TaxID=1219028 RepID=X0Q999_RHOWR|nr:hypothetical protein RW1_041_00160 [Rhodococcus wratislaviensis NBRC 100605]
MMASRVSESESDCSAERNVFYAMLDRPGAMAPAKIATTTAPMTIVNSHLAHSTVILLSMLSKYVRSSRFVVLGVRSIEFGSRRGVELLIGFAAISEPDSSGMHSVGCILNGQLRPVAVRDRSISAETPTAKKPIAPILASGSSIRGVVTLVAAEWDSATAGDAIEAMKMEAAITAHRSGTFRRLAIIGIAQVEGGDLVAVISVGDDQYRVVLRDPCRCTYSDPFGAANVLTCPSVNARRT